MSLLPGIGKAEIMVNQREFWNHFSVELCHTSDDRLVHFESTCGGGRGDAMLRGLSRVTDLSVQDFGLAMNVSHER